jgi:uncharacterized protein involved in outer membrane biogenesis
MKKKWIFRSVLGIFLVLIAGSVVLAWSLGAIVKAGVEKIGPVATQVEVKLKSAQVWLLAGRVHLAGIELGNPPGYKTPASVAVEDVRVHFKPASLLTDKWVVERIQIKEPVITWEGGLMENNLKKIEGNINQYLGSFSSAAKTDAPSTGGAKPGRKLQVDDLEISGAKVQFNTLLSGGHTITLLVPDIHLTELGSGPEGITSIEVGQRALHAVIGGAAKAMAENGTQWGKEALSGGKDGLKKTTGILKGLLH